VGPRAKVTIIVEFEYDLLNSYDEAADAAQMAIEDVYPEAVNVFADVADLEEI
jgi:hypothetical protein